MGSKFSCLCFFKNEECSLDHDNEGDIAYLGSENGSPLVHPLQERSGNDPTTEICLPQMNQNSDLFAEAGPSFHTQLTRTSSNVTTNNHCSTPNENEILSFEGLIRQAEESDSGNLATWEIENAVYIEELSDSEYHYLKPLLHVKIVAIFEKYKINYLKKASSKCEGENVFGVNLSTLVSRDMPTPIDNSMIPQVFQTIVNQLNSRCITEDGILRVAGQKQKLEYLCCEIEFKFYNNRGYVEELLQQATVHELTGVLKKLLRELPHPIFTMELFDMFYKAGSIPNPEDKVKALNLLVLLLPIENRNTFRILIELLLNIIKNENKNRMGLHNVAMITAPSFFPPNLLLPKDNRRLVGKQLSQEELAKQINGAAVCCCIMETLLKVGNKLWTVPLYLATQAREAQKKAQEQKDMGKRQG